MAMDLSAWLNYAPYVELLSEGTEPSTLPGKPNTIAYAIGKAKGSSVQRATSTGLDFRLAATWSSSPAPLR